MYNIQDVHCLMLSENQMLVVSLLVAEVEPMTIFSPTLMSLLLNQLIYLITLSLMVDGTISNQKWTKQLNHNYISEAKIKTEYKLQQIKACESVQVTLQVPF